MVEADTKWYAVFKSVPRNTFRPKPIIIVPEPPVGTIDPPRWWWRIGLGSTIRFGIDGYDAGQPLDISTTPEATVAVEGDERTATFTADGWNEPVDWSIVATQGEDSGELTENVDYTSEIGQDGVTTFVLPIIPTIKPDFCTILLYKVKFTK